MSGHGQVFVAPSLRQIECMIFARGVDGMKDSAQLRIDRATKHIDDLDKLFKDTPPAVLVMGTNIVTSERALYPKIKQAVLDEGTVVIGDALHNMRSALDHAYWTIVSPFVSNERDKRNIQFPFSATVSHLEDAIKKRSAQKVSTAFSKAICDMRPHKDVGGNEMLYAIHDLNCIDKHRSSVPMVDEQRFTVAEIRRFDSSFMPNHLPNLEVTLVGNPNIKTNWISLDIRDEYLGKPVPRSVNLFEYELPNPVNLVFSAIPQDETQKIVPTLYRMRDVCVNTIDALRAAA